MSDISNLGYYKQIHNENVIEGAGGGSPTSVDANMRSAVQPGLRKAYAVALYGGGATGSLPAWRPG